MKKNNLMSVYLLNSLPSNLQSGDRRIQNEGQKISES